MLDFVEQQIQKLKQLRKDQTVYDYHHAYGLLSDLQSHLLELAQQDDNNNERALEILAYVAATAQLSAEEFGMCKRHNDDGDNEVELKTCKDLIINLLLHIDKYSMMIDDPNQKNSKIRVVRLTDNILEELSICLE